MGGLDERSALTDAGGGVPSRLEYDLSLSLRLEFDDGRNATVLVDVRCCTRR
jgi:hypothetical protein